MHALLRRGDDVPHVEFRTFDGRTVSYRAIWQHRNLVLIALPSGDPAADQYRSGVVTQLDDLRALDAECVITCDAVVGLPAPGVLIADRWGEIVHVTAPPDVAGLPAPDEIVEWLEYTQRRCPECEGEAR